LSSFREKSFAASVPASNQSSRDTCCSRKVQRGFDLQLSGHTHGGQYFPGNLIIYLAQKFVAGLHRYKKTLIYVSRGTGYWGPPIRIGAPSEITKIVLVDSKAKNANIVKIKKEKRY